MLETQPIIIDGIIRSNGRAYSLKNDKHRFFYPSEYFNFFEKLKEKQKHTVKCLLNTGARINEMRNVRFDDIDFKNNRIVLRITKCKAKKGEKKGRIRTIPISHQFSKYLQKAIREAALQNEAYIGILSTPAINIGIKKAALKAGLNNHNDFSAHSIRKTAETWLMALGVDGLVLAAHFGHTQATAAASYVSPDVFTYEEKRLMLTELGDLYDGSRRYR